MKIPLPIDSRIPLIVETLAKNSAMVLIASPGAGKTTRVPAALLGSLAGDIIMLEPRRLAARAAAHRIAEENRWEVGQEVGYQVRFENRTSEKTRLTIMTEGLLSRRLTRDPELKGVSCVILDEFHERSWHSDIGLGLLRELQMLSRSDLKILVMSATLHAEKVSEYLGDVPIVEVSAPVHPIEVIHSKLPQILTSNDNLFDRVSAVIGDVLNGKTPGNGDILVFLPGLREISQVAARLDGRFPNIEIHRLHGSLKLEDQNRAILKSTKRKVILATNIAETSLTIDGVATVIDSGLARVARQDTNGFSHLELTKISQFSAIQRTGRAARQMPGTSYRLWSKLDEASMQQSEIPEILRTDLSEALLLLTAHGVSDAKSFSWFEKPSENSLQAAETLLKDLGAISNLNGQQKVTELGQKLLRWPLHPRLARMLEGAGRSLMKEAALIAAIISERDLLLDALEARSISNLESDVLIRAEVALGHLRARVDRAALANVERACEQFQKIGERNVSKVATASEVNDEFELLLLAFPDRVCRRRRADQPEARMVGGKGVKLSPNSNVTKSPLFIAVDAFTSDTSSSRDSVVTLASRIERESLTRLFPKLVSEKRKTEVDKQSGKVMTKLYLSYRDLPLEEGRQTEAKPEEIATLMPEIVSSMWEEILSRNEKIAAWISRFEFLKRACPDKAWPSVEFTKVENPEIQTLISNVALGEKQPQQFFEKDFVWALEDFIGSELAQFLKREAPESVQVPSGSRIKMHYPPDRPPYLEVRLQEVFGWKQAPALAEGRVLPVVQLLGPNYRPVQVTQDLARFWTGSYSEVRKELRARYPKHSWPEDPLNAPAVAKGRPTKA